MSLVLNVEILGEFKKLTEATKGSQKSLGGLEDNAKKVSKGINTALGAIGIGFSLGFLVNEFKESTRAAIEDQKSKILLSKALQDNLKVSEQQVDSIEDYISKTQIATNITDDKLRPAFAKLAIATKDTDQAMRLLNIATDVAAGTGKNLDAVVQAMARSLAGSDTALNRLVPSLKGAADPIAELERLFGGAAAAAANTDPYARLQIIFGEMQEQIGMALLPVLENFSTWLATPEGQEKMQGIVDGVVNMITEFTKLVDYISTQIVPTLETLTGEKGFAAVITAVTNLTIAIGLFKVALAIFSSGHPVLAGILLGLAALAGAMKIIYDRTKETNTQLAEFQRLQNLTRVTTTPSTPEQVAAETYQGLIPGLVPTPTPVAPSIPRKKNDVSGSTNVNININRAKVSGSEIIDQLNATLKARGLSRIAVK